MSLPVRGIPSLILLLLVVPVFGWAKAGEANSATSCAKCHEEGRTQPATEMAHALETGEDDPILSEHPVLTATLGAYSYRIERKGGESLYTVSDGTATMTLPIRYAMGESSALGQTYILEKDGKFFESRVSWFRALNGLGPTLGQQNSRPADLNQAAGQVLSPDDARRCFECHATNAVSGQQLTLDRMTEGVQCSHCHQATDAHLAALVKGSGEAVVPPALASLRHMSAEDASNFCGRCHRTWSDVVVHESYNIGDVRFQPYRLWSSVCYDPDDARISCLSCHDPHKEPSTQPVDYDAKCQACHGGGKAKAKTCRVSKQNCVSCHMPKVEIPGAHYKFTDHRIRVVKANEAFLP
ncbi:MAG TPA: multiheme c-type cytochrome [Terracidiphilus sp.]